MNYLVFILLVLFPLGQLARTSFLFNDVAVGAVVFIYAIRNFSKIVRDPITKPLVLWVLVMAGSLLINISNYSYSQILAAFFYQLRFLAYSGLYFLAQSHPLLKRGIILGIILVGVAGILQYLLLPDVSFLSAFDWDDHYYRLVSTFLDPGFTGVILLIGLVASHNPLFFIVIMLTYSRATYLAYLFSFAVLAIYQKSVKVFVIAALALAIALPLLPKSTGEGTKLSRENSIYARINNWKESISIWQKSPIFGVGYNTYRYVRTGVTAQSHSGAGADSSILFVLATTGVVGLLTYLYLLLTMARLGKNNPTFLAIMAGVFVHSWFNNTLFYPFVLECMWVLLGSRGEST